MYSFLRKWLPILLKCLIDCIFLNAAMFIAGLFYTYFLKTDSQILTIFSKSIPIMTPGCIAIFVLFGIYAIDDKQLSLLDFLKLAAASFFASFFAYASLKLVHGYWQSPIIGVTTFYLFLTLVVGMRILPTLFLLFRKAAKNALTQQDSRIPALIVGAGESASALLKDMLDHDDQYAYRVVGLVDDDERKQHHTLRGIRVIGTSRDIPSIIKKHGVQEIILAIPSASVAQRRELIARCMPTGCRVRSMSKISSLSQANVASLHDLNISDLLGRNEVRLDASSVETYITGAVVLVTGGGGSIGSELCRQLLRFAPKQLVILDIYENNAFNVQQELQIAFKDTVDILVRIGSVQDHRRMREVFEECKPDVVFHAAAYKHVPLMEQCPKLAIQNNVFGTYIAALMARRYKVRRFVMISTDKAVRPTNVMGASKRMAELIIHSLNGFGTEYVAVRFGNVLGSNGSVVPLFTQQIQAGGPVTITHPDVIRYFMTIPEAAQLVLQAGALARGGETFVLDMGGPVKILDLAKTMIELAGLAPDKDIQIVFTGLRPGEKLYEELLLSDEGTKKTGNDKILVAHAEVISHAARREMLKRLNTCIQTGGDIVALMQRLLPDYQPHPANFNRIDIKEEIFDEFHPVFIPQPVYYTANHNEH